MRGIHRGPVNRPQWVKVPQVYTHSTSIQILMRNDILMITSIVLIATYNAWFAWYGKLRKSIYASLLTHCGLVVQYGDIKLGQLWLRRRLGEWWHQTITWINDDLSSVKFTDNHLRTISQGIHQLSVGSIRLKIVRLKFYLNLLWANELTHAKLWWCGVGGIFREDDVNIMAADVLAPCVARPTAAMILTM